MNLKHIKVFVNVFQEKSVTRAAKRLGLTQPATSLAVRELEEYYGTKLFEKDGRGIRPTDAAVHFYPEASRLISLYDEMDAGMKNWNVEGRIKLGSSISIGSCILPGLIKKFNYKYRDLKIQVTIDSSDVIQNKIIENQLDFALIEGNVHSEKIVCEKFMQDELVPICSRFHKFAGREDVEISELLNEKFLMREPNSGTRQQAESCFKMNGIFIEPIWESTSTAALINAVAEDIGISVLPKRMLDYQIKMNKIFTFSIKGINLKRDYNIIYHENKFLNDTMKDFINMIKEDGEKNR